MSRQAALKNANSSATNVRGAPRAAARAPRRVVEAVRGNGAAPIQAKLEVHESDDEFEREADAVADQVMRMPAGEGVGGGVEQPGSSTRLQRVVEESDFSSSAGREEEETSRVQMRAELEGVEEQELSVEDSSIQREAEETFSVEDELQREEDAALEDTEDASIQREVDEDLQETSEVSIQRASSPDALEEELQREAEGADTDFLEPSEGSETAGELQRAGAPLIQREVASSARGELERELEEESESAELQRRSGEGSDEEGGGFHPPEGFEQELQAAKRGGCELPRDVREFMEVRFGRSFAGVRVHTDERAHALTRQVHARAFATGEHLFFQRGTFNPGTQAGKRLLAHELTHVVQQSTGLRTGLVQRQILQRSAERAALGSRTGSVQRSSVEVVQRDAATDEAELPLELDAAKLYATFGIERGGVPEEALLAVRGLLELGAERETESLRRLLSPTARTTTRTLISASFRLYLRVDARKEGTERSFHLERPDGQLIAQGLRRGELSEARSGSEHQQFDLTRFANEAEEEAGGQPSELQAPRATALTESVEAEAEATAEYETMRERAVRDDPQSVLELPEAPRIEPVDLAKAHLGKESDPLRALAQSSEPRILSSGVEEDAGGDVHFGQAPEASTQSTNAGVRASAEGLASAGSILGSAEEQASEAAAGPRAEAERIRESMARLVTAGEAAEEQHAVEESEASNAARLERAAEAAEAQADASRQEPGSEETASLTSSPEPIAGGIVEPEIPAADPEVEAVHIEERMEAAVGSGEPFEVSSAEEGEPLEELGVPAEALGETSVGGLDDETVAPALSVGEPPFLDAAPTEEPELETARLERKARAEGQRGTVAESRAEAEAQAEATAESELSGSWGEAALDLEEVGAESATDELLPAEKAAALATLAEGAIPAVGGGGGGAGGGGGGAASEAAPEPPDVSAMEPTEALGAVSGLRVTQIQRAVGGLQTSVATDAAKRQSELAAAPPSMESPMGSPITKAQAQAIPAAAPLPARADPRSIEAVPAGANLQTPEAKPLPEAPAPAIDRVGSPAVTVTDDGKVSPDAAKAMQARLTSLPTADPALLAQAGPAPTVQLEGNADPARMVEQHEEFRAKVTEARAKGAAEAAQPMGEDQLFPDVEPEVLTARVGESGASGGASAAGASASGGGAGGGVDEAVGILAEEERGEEVRSAVQAAQGQAGVAESEHAARVDTAATEHASAVAEAEQESAQAQRAERERAKSGVSAARGEWTEAQETELSEKDAQASEELSDKAREIADEKRSADEAAQEEIAAGNEKAEAERAKGEDAAAREKERGERESTGIFSWIASKAKAFFEGVKRAISAALEVARKAVKAAIEAAKKAAVAVIEAARKVAVALVQAAGDFLIRLGGSLLSSFPALREKFEKAIKDLVAAAEDAINRLAETLKNVAVALLDAYGQALDAALGLLEKGLHAAVDLVAGAVDGAIQFAKSVADKLGVFAQLISDIAADPGGWIGNLGASIVDGIKNHLWGAFKSAVSEWFNAKVEGLLAVGKTIWSLVTGELGFAEIGRMAWQAVQALIPPTLTRILIEKLVAMIVPAAGALLAVVEALQAAWGTVSRVIASLDLFVAFLKAVKGGGAGAKFAAALASAAIVVLDFVANYLIAKLGRGLRALSGKLKGIASRLMKKKRGAKAKRGRSTGRARGKRKPKTLRTKGQTARSRRKDLNQRRQEKKQDQLRDKQERVRQASAAARRALRRRMPGSEAKRVVRGIAGKYRVRSSIADRKNQWAIKFQVNPSIETFVKDNDSATESVKKVLEKTRVTRSSLEALLTSHWRNLVERRHRSMEEARVKAGKETETHRPFKASTEQMQQAIEDAGGLERFIRRLKKRGLVDGGQDSLEAGRLFEEQALAAHRAEVGDKGTVFSAPGLDSNLDRDTRKELGRSGFDSAAILAEERKVQIGEAKRGTPRAIDVKSTKKSAQSPQTSRLPIPEGVLPAEFVQEPGVAERIVAGETVRSEDGRDFENKVSAISKNLKKNLIVLQKQLQEALDKETKDGDPNVAARMRQERDVLQDLIKGTAGTLQVRLSTLSDPSPAELAAINRLFEVAARKLGNVKIEPIIVVLMSEEHEKVGGG